MSEQYEIVFRGDIQFGQKLGEVKSRLQQLFKIDSAKVDALFMGKPIALKRGLDKASAEKYRDMLLKAGALVEVVAVIPAVLGSLEGSTKAAVRVQQESEVEPVQNSQWTLAPVGSLLMSTNSFLAPASRQFNFSGYTLRPAGGNLVDITESRRMEPKSLAIPDYKVADVGSNLIDASEKLELPILEIDVEDWGLSEPGEPLLKDNEKRSEVSSHQLDPSFSLAPVGSVLDQIKPQVEIKIPDVSGLKIIEN